MNAQKHLQIAKLVMLFLFYTEETGTQRDQTIKYYTTNNTKI
jgi:hypothetical protein